MKNRTRSSSALPSKSTKHDFNILSSLTDSLGLSASFGLKKISTSELNIIRNALAQADKVRVAAWDPGAAYMSGVIDVITAMHLNATKKLKKLPGIDKK